ncbi:MAG: lipoprotein-releasing ABC transporter permease subunit [Deltaproteobacteria bacterium]|nr:lipoprotein-releasing ABC transporter permease subunit [Deltaproteobacteria bacterium]
MGFETFICFRYLKAKRKQGFISLITFISVAGVAVGVMALIVVLAVMAGFTSELRNKILGVNSHIVVQKLGGIISDYPELITTIQHMKGVKSVTPYIYAQTMITTGSNGTGIVLRGIDPESASSVLSLGSQLSQGDIAGLRNAEDEPGIPPGIIIGKHLASQLRTGMGERVRLLSPSGPLTPMGVIPKIKTCEVTGIFDTGMYEYDSSLAYISIKTAQRFLGIGDAVHGIEINVDDIYQAQTIAAAIEEQLGPGFVAKDWMRMNQNLFSALKLEKTAMFIILTLIVLVAAFNIISTLTMVVMEKTKDIAVLKSMGAKSVNILRIFVYEGLIIGCTGTALGVAGGLGLCKILSRYQFIKLPSDVYPMSTLPVKVLPLDVTSVAIAAVLITFLATIYPSWQASRIEPAEALRY